MQAKMFPQTTPAPAAAAAYHHHPRPQQPPGPGGFLDVVDESLRCMHSVPLHLVSHIPPQRQSRVTLCRNYKHGQPASCLSGVRCKFVHIECDLEALPAPILVHARYIYQHPQDCVFPRLGPGQLLTVSAPNNRMPYEQIPSECVLATRGSLNRDVHRGQLSHCAHYHFNSVCKRGPACHFIHAVAVDARIPPGMYGRASHTCSLVFCPLAEEAQRPAMDFAVLPPPLPPPTPMTINTFSGTSSDGSNTPQPSHRGARGPPLPSGCSSDEGEASTDSRPQAASEPLSPLSPSRVYRHNPYGTQSSHTFL